MARKHREIGKAGWGYTLITSIVGLIYFFPVLWPAALVGSLTASLAVAFSVLGL